MFGGLLLQRRHHAGRGTRSAPWSAAPWARPPTAWAFPSPPAAGSSLPPLLCGSAVALGFHSRGGGHQRLPHSPLVVGSRSLSAWARPDIASILVMSIFEAFLKISKCLGRPLLGLDCSGFFLSVSSFPGFQEAALQLGHSVGGWVPSAPSGRLSGLFAPTYGLLVELLPVADLGFSHIGWRRDARGERHELPYVVSSFASHLAVLESKAAHVNSFLFSGESLGSPFHCPCGCAA